MPELKPGDPRKLGEYEIIGRLGEGGQGVVYLGRTPAGIEVAVKLLRADLAENESARTRFVREVQSATKVARFCTAQVIEADVAGDRPFIVSEYVPGPSLQRQVTDEGPRSGAALERLAVGTATALVAIHQADIVHRDFKPHNVLIGPDGPRVIDFGIARALDVDATSSTGAIGTPAYMAPEQIMGRTLTPSVDTFSWASTIVFASTGAPPFGQDSIPAVVNRILNEEPDIGQVPDELRELVRACLAKDPAQRPKAQDLLMALLGQDGIHPVPGAGTAGAMAAGAVDAEAGPRAVAGTEAVAATNVADVADVADAADAADPAPTTVDRGGADTGEASTKIIDPVGGLASGAAGAIGAMGVAPPTGGDPAPTRVGGQYTGFDTAQGGPAASGDQLAGGTLPGVYGTGRPGRPGRPGGPTGPGGPEGPGGPGGSGERSRWPLIGAVAGALVALLLIGGLILRLTGGDDKQAPTPTPTPTVSRSEPTAPDQQQEEPAPPPVAPPTEPTEEPSTEPQPTASPPETAAPSTEPTTSAVPSSGASPPSGTDGGAGGSTGTGGGAGGSTGTGGSSGSGGDTGSVGNSGNTGGT